MIQVVCFLVTLSLFFELSLLRHCLVQLTFQWKNSWNEEDNTNQIKADNDNRTDNNKFGYDLG